jgi:hypothetical protein
MTHGPAHFNKAFITLFITLGSLLAAPGIGAETFAESIQQCQTNTNQNQRYRCYDQAEQALVQNVNRDVGKFSYESTTDPVTGQTLYTVFLRSDLGLNRRGNPVELKITCDSTQHNDYQLVLSWGEFLPSTQPEVTTRIGQGNPVTGTWYTDRFRQSTVFAGGQSGFSKIDFIDQLEAQVEAGNPTLVFRTTPYNYTAITAEFNMAGFVDVIEPMRASCKF